MYSASVESDTMAKKAVVLPIAMSSMRTVITTSNIRALSGIWNVGLTRAKKLENGRPLSRANAHVRRDTEVSVENRTIMPR